MPRHDRYTAVAIALHWTIAMVVLLQLSLGWWMVEIPKQPPGLRAWWFNLHKSIGLLLLALIVARLAWRLTHNAPALPLSMAPWQRGAAAASHALMYLLLIVVPISGYLGSAFSGYPVLFFGWRLPEWGWKWPEAKEVLSRVHFATTLALAVLASLHVVAAVTHLVRRDGIFQRMWPVGHGSSSR